MTGARHSELLVARRLAARLHALIGAPGWIGVLLAASGAAIAMATHTARIELRATVAAAALRGPTRPPMSAPHPEVAKPVLATFDEIPTLLLRVQMAAVENGLGWTAAEYRIVDATAGSPASLEVRCAFVATYPRVKAMIAGLAASLPSMVLRDFSANRATTDQPDIEAKIVLAVLLEARAADGERAHGAALR